MKAEQKKKLNKLMADSEYINNLIHEVAYHLITIEVLSKEEISYMLERKMQLIISRNQYWCGCSECEKDRQRLRNDWMPNSTSKQED